MDGTTNSGSVSDLERWVNLLQQLADAVKAASRSDMCDGAASVPCNVVFERLRVLASLQPNDKLSVSNDGTLTADRPALFRGVLRKAFGQTCATALSALRSFTLQALAEYVIPLDDNFGALGALTRKGEVAGDSVVSVAGAGADAVGVNLSELAPALAVWAEAFTNASQGVANLQATYAASAQTLEEEKRGLGDVVTVLRGAGHSLQRIYNLLCHVADMMGNPVTASSTAAVVGAQGDHVCGGLAGAGTDAAAVDNVDSHWDPSLTKHCPDDTVPMAASPPSSLPAPLPVLTSLSSSLPPNAVQVGNVYLVTSNVAAHALSSEVEPPSVGICTPVRFATASSAPEASPLLQESECSSGSERGMHASGSGSDSECDSESARSRIAGRKTGAGQNSFQTSAPRASAPDMTSLRATPGSAPSVASAGMSSTATAHAGLVAAPTAPVMHVMVNQAAQPGLCKVTRLPPPDPAKSRAAVAHAQSTIAAAGGWTAPLHFASVRPKQQ